MKQQSLNTALDHAVAELLEEREAKEWEGETETRMYVWIQVGGVGFSREFLLRPDGKDKPGECPGNTMKYFEDIAKAAKEKGLRCKLIRREYISKRIK